MPASEALKGLVGYMIVEQVDVDGDDLVFGGFDVSRAHFIAEAERELYANSPDEIAEAGHCAKLNRTMYGTQDAARLWGELWANHLEKGHEYQIGKSSRALYQSKCLQGLCHGDDFVGVASEKHVQNLRRTLEEVFEVKQVGLIGFAEHLDKEQRVLSRFVNVNTDKEQMEVEDNPKHVEMVLEELGMRTCKPMATPRDREDKFGDEKESWT